MQYDLPVKIVILNNRLSGHGPAVAGTLLRKAAMPAPAWTTAPDFVKLAEAYGAVGLRATRPEEVVAGPEERDSRFARP